MPRAISRKLVVFCDRCKTRRTIDRPPHGIPNITCPTCPPGLGKKTLRVMDS
jgi:hypothetical protein